MSEPRYFPNDLQPISLDESSLLTTLTTLQTAIASAVGTFSQHVKASRGRSAIRDSLYTGDSGIALMFLRLAVQLDAAGLRDVLGKDIKPRFPLIIEELLPDLKAHHVRSGHLSPLDSPVGSALLYILASLNSPSEYSKGERPSTADTRWTAAMKTLERAVLCAAEDEGLGGDEVLYGRAGLLWGMLNLHLWIDADTSAEKHQDVARVASTTLIARIMKRIIEAGEAGAQLYEEYHGESALPLMWMWHEKYYLGAIHGAAGILTVLLQAPRNLVIPYLPIICRSISVLCAIAYRNDGHLPSSLPEKPRAYHLVQICHGSPGLVLLLATFRICFPDEWKKDWDVPETLATDKVWKEGLVRKGIGICHGVSGNAWPLLLQAHAHGRIKDSDSYLSQALAYLILTTELPPLSGPTGKSLPFRMPDHPLSLFEGLAGAVCAWLDACIVIRERLGDGNGETKKSILGFPGLGGAGVHGPL